MNIEYLLKEINLLKIEYDKIREKNKFNVFTAMYKHNEEVKLHSRFISYLLCSKSGHGMENIFFKLFLDKVLILDNIGFDFNNYQVIPNEQNKSEYKEIDILITDKTHAIIIENKIDAPDSYHKFAPEGYKGQLERYYNTIKNGETKNQKKGIKKEFVFVYYLSNNKLPSPESIGEGILKTDNLVKVISYENQIRDWLQKCIEQKELLEKPAVKEFIQQYLNLINKITNNDMSTHEIIELKKQISNNLLSSQHLINNFKHVKENTVIKFWQTLKEEINKKFKNDKFYTDAKHSDFNKTIAEITNFNKEINHGILFDFEDGQMAYISGKAELSWGILNRGWFSFEGKEIAGIKFSDFSNETTFSLINDENMETIIKLIIEEIIEKQKFNFTEMKSF